MHLLKKANTEARRHRGNQEKICEHNLPIMRRYVNDILTVTEAEIIETLKFLWTRLKLVVEPSSPWR